MSRLSHLGRDALPPESRPLFDDLERERGFVPNLYAVLAHSPRLLAEFLSIGAAMRAPGALPAPLKELAILRVAALTGAETMKVSHLAAAHAAGLTDADVAALEPAATGHFGRQQLAILRFVDEVTRDVGASDAAWSAVASFLSEEQLVELTVVAAFYNLVARVLRTADVDLDPRYAAW